jgi:methylamine dehydrogenase accessory protein MauD
MKYVKIEWLLITLMTLIVIVMVGNFGLLLKINQIQERILSISNMPVSTKVVGLFPGTKAPDFSLQNSDRQLISLKDYSGNALLMMFSQVGCPYCDNMYSNIKNFSEQHQHIQIIMVSMGTLEENKFLIENEKFSFTVLTADEAVFYDYHVPGTPFFMLIDENGMVVKHGFANSMEELESLANLTISD